MSTIVYLLYWNTLHIHRHTPLNTSTFLTQSHGDILDLWLVFVYSTRVLVLEYSWLCVRNTLLMSKNALPCSIKVFQYNISEYFNTRGALWLLVYLINYNRLLYWKTLMGNLKIPDPSCRTRSCPHHELYSSTPTRVHSNSWANHNVILKTKYDMTLWSYRCGCCAQPRITKS